MPRRRLPPYLPLGLIASLALCVLVAAPDAQAIPPLQIFTAGLPAAAGPVALAAAPDGDVWFSQDTPGTPLGRIAPDGTITEQPMPALAARLTSPPLALAVGPDGDVWLIAGSDILRVTPTGSVTDYGQSQAPFSPPPLSGVSPVGIAVASDGSLWLTDTAGGGAIGHLTEPGQLTEYRAGLTRGGGVQGIAPGPDGDMWFTEADGRIGRITPQGAITEYAAATGSPYRSSPVATATCGSPSRAPWTGLRASRRVGRSRNSRPAPLPQGIAPGPDGQIYVTEPYGLDDGVLDQPPAIAAISATGVVSQEVIGTAFPFIAAWNLVAAADGALWLTFPGDPAAIGELAFAPTVTPGVAPAVTGTGATLLGDVQTNGQTDHLLLPVRLDAGLRRTDRRPDRDPGHGRVPGVGARHRLGSGHDLPLSPRRHERQRHDRRPRRDVQHRPRGRRRRDDEHGRREHDRAGRLDR